MSVTRDKKNVLMVDDYKGVAIVSVVDKVGNDIILASPAQVENEILPHSGALWKIRILQILKNLNIFNF